LEHFTAIAVPLSFYVWSEKAYQGMKEESITANTKTEEDFILKL
jgi:hypothetical protein